MKTCEPAWEPEAISAASITSKSERRSANWKSFTSRWSGRGSSDWLTSRPVSSCEVTPSTLGPTPLPDERGRHAYHLTFRVHLFYITKQMKRGELLGSLEHIILLALARLDGG